MSIDTRPAAADEALRLAIGNGSIELELVADGGPVRIARLGPAGAAAELGAGRPAVEVLTVDAGHAPSTPRLVGTTVGGRFAYVDTVRSHGRLGEVVEVRSADDEGLEAVLRVELIDGAAALRTSVTVRNTGERVRVLRSVTSFAARVAPGGAASPDDLALASAVSDWVGESRWSVRPLRDLLVDLRSAAHQHGDARGCYSVTSTGTWSTGRALPVGVLEGASGGSIAWQVEHNGGWRWETGEDAAGAYLALSGPTDADHQWLLPLAPGEAFETVPALVAVGDGLEGAVAALTAARRASRRPHPDDGPRPVVFNDYMNTLMGDPTTEKLLPLIEQAAEAGAEIFCIDAGWYDDSGDWWPSVGDWQPSTVRFPDGGLAAVVRSIQEHGMVAGLWLEPEVIGVDSPAALRLPDDAFLQRAGQRIVEHERYHLDLRHPAAIAHLDEVVDRLVRDLGVGYFKLDYNINPGPGTDVSAASAGDGLLQHNRAHLAWLDSVLDRHPDLVLENCGSGAMRMDWAMLSRLQLQSTSDQQSPEAYPPIAAAAPLAMPPEQAANWAYPQPDMTDEEIGFTLATAMLGRFYLSGRLDGMTPAQRLLVAEGVAAHKRLRPAIAAASAFWPLGIDQWTAPWVALGLADGDEAHLTLWRRLEGEATVEVPLPAFRGGPLHVETVFPLRLTPWTWDWDAERGVLTVTATVGGPGARTLRIGRTAPVDHVVVDAARTTGAVRGGATGMLYGLGDPGVPSPALLAGARPRTVAQKAPGGLQHPGGDAVATADDFFAAGGEEVLVYLQDALPSWPYDEVGIERYVEIAVEAARIVAARADRDRFVHVPFNEADWIWYADWSPAGRDRFLADWARVVRALRDVDPGARVAGPNDASYHPGRMRDFLAGAAEQGVLPDVVTWHELQPSTLELLPAHLEHYRALERRLGLGPLPVNIDEYANRRDTSVPGRMLQWIDVLETGKVDGDIAYWTAAGNLDDHAVRDGEANGGWWLLHWYAALRGATAATAVPAPRVRDSLHALATTDDRAVTVLLGGGRHDVDLEVRGMPAGRWRVRVERADWSGYEGALAAPRLLADDAATVEDGALRVRVPNADPLAAYRVAVLPGADRRGAVDADLVIVPADDADSAGERPPVDQEWQQYAGTGRAGLLVTPDEPAVFTVRVPEGGDQEVALLYGTDGVPGALEIRADDGGSVRVHLPAVLTRGYLGRATARVRLDAGEHRLEVRVVRPGAVLLDRLEVAPVREAVRLDAALALRDGGRLRSDGAVELDDGDRLRFFVGVAERARYRIRVSADADVTLHGRRLAADERVALAAGITEVTVTGPGVVAGLVCERVEDLPAPAPMEEADGIEVPGGGPHLVVIRYTNDGRASGHRYNADVVHRRLGVRVGGGTVQEAAFPYTHDRANLADRALVLDVPEGGGRIMIGPVDDAPPDVHAVAVHAVFEGGR